MFNFLLVLYALFRFRENWCGFCLIASVGFPNRNCDDYCHTALFLFSMTTSYVKSWGPHKAPKSILTSTLRIVGNRVEMRCFCAIRKYLWFSKIAKFDKAYIWFVRFLILYRDLFVNHRHILLLQSVRSCHCSIF